VVDAIKWVMGEQSAKNLRGRAMDDVIFNGSESRGPHGFAEVTITFGNDDGLAPPEYRDYSEITVSRRLDREGRSDYLINKTPVRLLDITNLFLGTGVGKRAYSIIEQGRIGFIVSSKPIDRRHLIEEAAGVTKFKARKKAAERKMDQTRQNLLRVSDIIQEIERSLTSLKRQAQKAERYTRYRSEQRDLELHVATHRWLELTGTHRVVASDLATESAGSEGQRLGLRVREAEIETERIELQAKESVVDRAQTRAYEIDNSLQLMESQIENTLDRLTALRDAEAQGEREIGEIDGQAAALRDERAMLAASLDDLEAREQDAAGELERETEELERRRGAAVEAERVVSACRARVGEADTQIARCETVLNQLERRRTEERERIAAVGSERDALLARVVELGHAAAELAARLDALRSGKAQTAAQREEIEAELQKLRDDIRESDTRVESQREELAQKRSRLRSLMEIQERFEGVGTGVRALMRLAHEGRVQGVVGLFADRVDCPPNLTRALAAALGPKLQYVVVDSAQAGADALDALREQGTGRATVVPRSPRRIVAPPREVPQAPGVVGRLADLVDYEEADVALVRHMLGDVLVVETLADALDAHRSRIFDGVIVSRRGDLVSPDGAMTGGAGDDAGAHMLEVKREIRELHGAVERAVRELDAAQAVHGDLRAAIAARQAALDSARTEAHDADLAIVEADKDHRRTEEDAAAATKRADLLATEMAKLTRAVEENREEAAARVAIAEAQREREEAVAALGAAEEVLEDRRGTVEAHAARVTEVRVLAAQAKERAEADRAAMARMLRSVEDLESRRVRLAGDLIQSAQHQGRLLGHLMVLREKRHAHVGLANAAHEELGAVRADYEAARGCVTAQEEALKELRTLLDTSTRRMGELALREKELAMARGHLVEQVAERHRVDLPRVLGDYHDRPLPDAIHHERVAELNRLIERMGEINLTAIEEYDEKSQRYEYLTGQRKDLDDALRQLDRAIRQMNKESRRLFAEAFEAVNERFKKVYPTMFGGGRAELRLTDPDDMLESGVEIIAQPPGKRLGSLELMSGGEKALTAVSLIFAIFQYKPSPFCLLDEVDAPLDEANIGRFSDAVRQMTDRSQFIIITHAKRTMEATDVLYGVTMEEPGVSKLVSVELRGEGRRSLTGRAAVA
jgi:chromosome segregation protein